MNTLYDMLTNLTLTYVQLFTLQLGAFESAFLLDR